MVPSKKKASFAGGFFFSYLFGSPETPSDSHDFLFGNECILINFQDQFFEFWDLAAANAAGDH